MLRILLPRLLGCVAVVTAIALSLPALSRPAFDTEKPLGKLPADLKLVPRDAFMVISLRPADILASESGKPLFESPRMQRELFQFGHPLSSVPADNIERLTLFARRFHYPPLAIVHTKKPFDVAALRKGADANNEHKVHGKTIFGQDERWGRGASLWIVDEQTFVVGHIGALVPYLAAIETPAKSHLLADELQTAAGKHALTVALLPSLMFRTSVSEERANRLRWEKKKFAPKDGFKKEVFPKDGFEKKDGVRAEFLRVQFKQVAQKEGPIFRDKDGVKDGFRPRPPQPEDFKEQELKLESLEDCFDWLDESGPFSAIFRPYVRCQRLLLTTDLAADIKATVKATFRTDAEAKDGVVAGKMALILMRDSLPMMMNSARDMDPRAEPFATFLRQTQSALRTVEFKRDGSTVEASATAKIDTLALGKWINEQVPVMEDLNNLKQLGIAFHNHHDAMGHIAQAICDPRGKPLLSWRVAILPYIEQDALYRQFKLDEPWNSPHNKKLLAKMPKIYAPIKGIAAEPDATFYQVFTGPGTLFPTPDAKVRIFDITDGTSNTFLVTEASRAVPWTKPEDIVVTDKAVPKLGGQFKGFFHVAFCDGSVRKIRMTTKPEIIRAYITPRGGEVIPRDD